MSNFNHLLRKMMSGLNVCLHLKTTLHASTKVKGFDKNGEEVLAYCDKHSEDSVELAHLCRLLFFTI